MSDNKINFLIKIGKEEHINSLRKNGVVFMNSLNYFKKLEGDEQRGDIREGVEKITQISWMKLLVEGREIELRRDGVENRLTSGQLRVENPNLEGNIFSMMAISTDFASKTDRIDNRNAAFGDSFLVIFNPKEFLERISKSLKELNLQHSWDMVHYYDEISFDGELGIFHKPLKYKHQNEVRIFVNNKKSEPLILNIGSIEDISEVFEIEKLENLRIETDRFEKPKIGIPK